MISDTPLQELVEADLQALIDNGTMEDKGIEYKRELDLDTDKGKLKFISSVSAFANGSGGDMIVGINAKDGKPVCIDPLKNVVIDLLQLRIFQILRDGIDPKVYGIEVREIAVAGGSVILLRIPKMYDGAHQVIYNKDYRFYVRHDNGKVPMDVREVKRAFTLSDTTADTIRRWRAERIGNILSNETPCDLIHPRRTAIHLAPICAFAPLFKPNLTALSKDRRLMVPINEAGSNHHVDFGGHFTHGGAQRSQATGYIYAMRDGCIEGVDADLLTGNNDLIPYAIYEPRIVRFVERGLLLLKLLGAVPPFLIYVSLLNVKGQKMAVTPG